MRRPFRLLAISDHRPEPGESMDAWSLGLAATGIDAALLRQRDWSDVCLLAAAQALRQIFPAMSLLLHRRPDLAALARSKGLHLPAHGMSTPAARRIVGTETWIGRSTHELAEVERAVGDGTDYVLFGPILPTPGKPSRSDGFGDLARAVRVAGDLPVIALGGLSAADFGRVAATGASGVAGIRLFHAESPAVIRAAAEAAFGPLEAA